MKDENIPIKQNFFFKKKLHLFKEILWKIDVFMETKRNINVTIKKEYENVNCHNCLDNFAAAATTAAKSIIRDKCS